MIQKDTESLIPGRLVAFIVLCVVWVLVLSGPLNGLLEGI
jgi:hypothetical protein